MLRTSLYVGLMPLKRQKEIYVSYAFVKFKKSTDVDILDNKSNWCRYETRESVSN